MSDYTERGPAPVEDAAVDDPPTIDEVMERQREEYPDQAATSTLQPGAVPGPTLGAVIEVKGRNGESIVFDGTYVSKFRHDGKDEAAKNPASTYRQCNVKAKKRKGDREQEYEVLLAMSSFMSLTIGEGDRPQLDALIAQLESIAAH